MACLSAPAFAQSHPSSPEDIDVPAGHKLVEIGPTFKMVNAPVEQKVSGPEILVPPIYRQWMENGVRKREIVVPPKPTQQIVMGPYRSRYVRQIIDPPSYALQDANGRVVKRWRWIKGKLTEV